MSHYIIKYSTDYGSTILSWVQDKNELFNWCTREDFPLLHQSIFEQWHLDPEIDAYLLFSDEDLIGYGEIWFDERDNSSELARLLIRPDYRRKGFASVLINLLLDKIKHEGKMDTYIRLIPSNHAAQACYQKNQFSVLPIDTQEMLNKGESYEYIWMKLNN